MGAGDEVGKGWEGWEVGGDRGGLGVTRGDREGWGGGQEGTGEGRGGQGMIWGGEEGTGEDKGRQGETRGDGGEDKRG